VHYNIVILAWLLTYLFTYSISDGTALYSPGDAVGTLSLRLHMMKLAFCLSVNRVHELYDLMTE